MLASGRLRFTDSYVEAADFADVHFLTVGTPQNETGLGANLSYLNAAIDALSPHLNRPALIVGSRPYRWHGGAFGKAYAELGACR